jgi:sugar-phosphatase
MTSDRYVPPPDTYDARPRFEAAIFDLDGLLIDSEPLWRMAEMEVFAAIGVTLTEEECHLTTGLRTEHVVAYWLERRPWDTNHHSAAEVAERINQRVIELIGERGEAKQGVGHALEFMRSRGLCLALASSSAMSVIEAAIGKLGLERQFEVVHSADSEPCSKPAPDVYLGAARRLGVAPHRCIALEDSLPGVEAAKAAGMACIRFPEHKGPTSNADLELRSHEELDEHVWLALQTIRAASAENVEP